MPSVLLALDIDGTLCDSQQFADLFAIDRMLWQEEIAAAAPPPLLPAVEALRPQLACEVIMVTSRPESLREATASWILRHFPQFKDSLLLMRSVSDERPGFEVKQDHLDRVRGGRAVVLVDDDPMAPFAIRRDDRWLRAPGEWHLLDRVLARLEYRRSLA